MAKIQKVLLNPTDLFEIPACRKIQVLILRSVRSVLVLLVYLKRLIMNLGC